MKTSFVKSLAVGLVLVASMSATVFPAGAANLYSSGDKPWNTSANNWGTVSGGSYNTAIWNNTTPDSAIFEGTAGTVTLGEAISIQNLTINVAIYRITGNTLNFASGFTITTPNPPDGNPPGATIESNITGAPAVNALALFTNERFTFNPAVGGSMALGVISGNSGTSAGIICFQGGAGSISVVASVNGPKSYFEGSGTWTLTGLATSYENIISSGTLIISTGTMQNNNRATSLTGGTLHYNNPAAIRDSNGSFNIDSDFRLRGGSMDQSSGAAITNSTWNPEMAWEANWTFIGSQGTNSDLYLGNGNVVLVGGTRQVSVQNAATTLAVGGVISGTNGLTKAGAGTLELRGVSTYTGATTVSNGTLLIKSPGSLDASSAVAVNGGTLGGNGTVGGTVTVGAAGSIAPSAPGASSVGTLSIGGNLDVSAMANGGTGKLKFDLDAPPPGVNNDKIAVTGTLTIGSGVLGLSDFVFTKSAGFTEGTYTLITSGGINPGDTLHGSDFKALIDDLVYTIRINGNNLELDVRPEPGTVIIIR